MSQLKLTADGGGGTVSLKGPSSTTGNAAIELTVPGTGNATLLTSATSTGKILKVVQTTKTDTTSTTSSSWSDITGMSVSITPSSSTSKIFVETRFKAVSNDVMYVALTTGDGTGIIQATGSGYTEIPSIMIYSGGNSSGESWYNGDMSTVCKLHEPNTTNAVTYKLRWRINSGTGYLNRNMDMGAQYNVAVASTITAFEVAA